MKTIRIKPIFLILFLFIFCNGISREKNSKSCKNSKMQNELHFSQRVKEIMNQWNAPGAVVAIVKYDKVLFSDGFGTTRLNGNHRVKTNTLTSVASVTKAFNSVALGMLVAEGLISWDDPVRKYVPEFQFVGPYRSNHTTIRDLITHRSGLPPIMGRFVSMDFKIPDLLQELPESEPAIGFRERVAYSQTGIALLGEIVKRVTGKSWSSFVQNRIFYPLKMNSSYPDSESFLEKYPNPTNNEKIMGRVIRKNGKYAEGKWWPVGNIYTPAGGIVTTGEDMVKFMQFIIRKGRIENEQLITLRELVKLHTPQEIDRGPYSSLINPETDLVAYCLGWFAHEFKGHKVVEHAGSNFGSSVVAFIPEEGIGVFVSSNATFSLDSDRMVSAIKFTALDFALGRPYSDWIKLLKSSKSK